MTIIDDQELLAAWAVWLLAAIALAISIRRMLQAKEDRSRNRWYWSFLISLALWFGLTVGVMILTGIWWFV